MGHVFIPAVCKLRSEKLRLETFVEKSEQLVKFLQLGMGIWVLVATLIAVHQSFRWANDARTKRSDFLALCWDLTGCLALVMGLIVAGFTIFIALN